METNAESFHFRLKRKLGINLSLVRDAICKTDYESGSDSDSDDTFAEKTFPLVFPSDASDCQKLYLLSNLPNALNFEGDSFLYDNRPQVRRGNMHCNREIILQWSNAIEDSMFIRQFRLCREDFHFVLQKVKPIVGKDVQQAMNSSGSSITPQLMLMITLRILAGASYLDMIHYHVHVDSVNKIFWDTVTAIHDAVDNIGGVHSVDRFWIRFIHLKNRPFFQITSFI